MRNMKLIHGECLEEMAKLPNNSVDMVMTDPPYGTTQCKWDSVIPLGPMWEQLKRITKPNGAIVMTASQPFTTTLIASNMKMFKYCWVWEKEQGTGLSRCKFQPMRKTEDVLIFSTGSATYNPQMVQREKPLRIRSSFPKSSESDQTSNFKNYDRISTETYPTNILRINRDRKKGVRGLHPTQKPVALMEYLIKTYTNEGETVLDFTMGSGTTGVACACLNRNFVGIEKDDKYFEIAKRRIGESSIIV